MKRKTLTNWVRVLSHWWVVCSAAEYQFGPGKCCAPSCERRPKERSGPPRRKRRLQKHGDLPELTSSDEPAQPGGDTDSDSEDAMNINNDSDNTTHKKGSRASKKKC